MSKNSLTKLIGQYSSDSENEDESTQSSSANGRDNTNLKEKHPQLPTTHWTQCTDPNTGHPYYWNVETKEVTWEPPADYENYLSIITRLFTKIPDDCWIRGYSQAAHAPYYVNEYTRVVSWEKPAKFKERAKNNEKNVKVENDNKIIPKNTRTDVIRQNKNKTKNKTLPAHLQHSSDDEKIELITSYSKGESSSDEDGTKKEKEEKTVKTSNCNLVAAYATDGSDSDVEEKSCLAKPQVLQEKQLKQEDMAIANEPTTKLKNPEKEISNSSNSQTNTFSNIIVGGISNSNTIDEEIMRLKKELEKDLGSFECENQKQEKSPAEQDENFDEKTFQRKKRIQFKAGTKRDENSRNGEKLAPKLGNVQEKEKYNLYKNFRRSHVEFENTKESGKISTQVSNAEDTSITTDSNALKSEIDDLSELISGKVKYLAVGHPDVTAVQAMNIQLETLLAAFRSSALDPEYFFKWLKLTSDDLINLEQNACPDGWKCMWDRESSQYCYKNLTTGDIQWEFPEDKTNDPIEEDGIAGGEDEMDISTTPPPNENEQLKIENEIPPWDESNAPSPPIISVQPPPPPNINCELASFYSDIATIESSTTQGDSSQRSPTGGDAKKRIIIDDSAKKKRKKVKVQGLGLKMKEVSNMVANWKKAQKELDN